MSSHQFKKFETRSRSKSDYGHKNADRYGYIPSSSGQYKRKPDQNYGEQNSKKSRPDDRKGNSSKQSNSKISNQHAAEPAKKSSKKSKPSEGEQKEWKKGNIVIVGKFVFVKSKLSFESDKTDLRKKNSY